MHRARCVWPALVGLSVLLSCRPVRESSAVSRPADLVVYGRVWTGDSASPWAQGVAVTGDTISEVGDSGRIARLVGRSTRVISNGRAMVVPGFMDAHVHFVDGGFQL